VSSAGSGLPGVSNLENGAALDRGASKSKFLSIVYEMRVWDLGAIPLPVSELEVTAVSPA
jgi:hypothetical protein